VVAPMAVNFFSSIAIACARTGTDQDVHAEILQRGIDHFFDVRLER
jgi:hypothetical protein